MKLKKQKYFILLFCISLVSFFSCKKEKIDGINNCCCPTQTALEDSVPVRLDDIRADGFFVMRKYYTITATSINLDSTSSLGFETIKGEAQIGYTGQPASSSGGIYYFVDSVKVNGIRFQNIVPWVLGTFRDSTHTNFLSPRHYQFYVDTTYFDIIDYIDYSPLPDYTGYNLLPDSVTYNKDFYVNIGNRTGTKECQLIINTARYSWTYVYNKYVPNGVNAFTISTNNLPYDWHTDHVTINLALRNWTHLKIKGRDYYLVSEHIYQRN